MLSNRGQNGTKIFFHLYQKEPERFRNCLFKTTYTRVETPEDFFKANLKILPILRIFGGLLSFKASEKKNICHNNYIIKFKSKY